MDWTLIVVAVLGSNALVELVKWLTTRKKPKPSDKLLVALAQDRIVYVGSGCIKQGYITREQLTILTSIITPYRQLGGDGLADAIMDRCRSLPIRTEKEMTVSEIQAEG